MGRRPCCSKVGLNRGAWTKLEDQILTDYINVYGEGNWNNLPNLAGLKRCGKSCRLRWVNYLRPDIKRGNISKDEEDLIIRMHKLLGNRWSLIAGRLPGRTDNEIKNYWNTTLRKKLEPSNPKMITNSYELNKAKTEGQEAKDIVEPVRTKAFRFTSRITQTLMPKTTSQLLSPKSDHSTSVEDQGKYSSGELVINCHDSTVEEDETLDLMIEYSATFYDDLPQTINGNLINNIAHESPPSDEQGILDDGWIMARSSNLGEHLIGGFDDDLGMVDFDVLASFLDLHDQECS